MERKNVPFYFEGLYFGDFEAYVCPICGDTLFTEDASMDINKVAVELGVWGRSRIHPMTLDFTVSTEEARTRSIDEIFLKPLATPKVSGISASG